MVANILSAIVYIYLIFAPKNCAWPKIFTFYEPLINKTFTKNDEPNVAIS